MSENQPSEEYLRGWKAARAYYQATGGVPPYPKGYYPETPTEPAIAQGASRPPRAPEPKTPVPGTGSIGRKGKEA